MSDEDLERVIADHWQRCLELYDRDDRDGARAAFQHMRETIARRSPERVAQMERDQTLR